MEKTVKEWYNQLPEPVRSQAIKNCERPDMVVDSLLDALIEGFYWFDTPQDGDYWWDIYCRAKDGEFDNPPPITNFADRYRAEVIINACYYNMREIQREVDKMLPDSGELLEQLKTLTDQQIQELIEKIEY